MSQSSFGDELRRLREEHGLSLKKFAQLVHYDSGYLSKVDNGLKPPSETLAEACDEALDTGGALSALVPLAVTPKPVRLKFREPRIADELWTSDRIASMASDSLALTDDHAGRAVTAEAASELLTVAGTYRRSYRSMPAAALLEASPAPGSPAGAARTCGTVMTILEQLAATTDPVWLDMINRRRTSTTSASAPGSEPLPSHPGAEWGRRGGSHFKNDEFTKKA